MLVESKYTESYPPHDGRYSERGTDRLAIYRHALDASWSPIRADGDPADLFWEPFDQHLRQQLLAAAMQQRGELGFATVRLAHVSPRGNDAFNRGITAPSVRSRGTTVADAWRSVLKEPDHYCPVHYEDLFGVAVAQGADPAWIGFHRARYGWAV